MFSNIYPRRRRKSGFKLSINNNYVNLNFQKCLKIVKKDIKSRFQLYNFFIFIAQINMPQSN